MRVNATRCACGTRLPDGTYYCTGFSAPIDTYMCKCDCHYPEDTTPDLSDPSVVDAIFEDARHVVRAEQRARASSLRRQRNE